VYQESNLQLRNQKELSKEQEEKKEEKPNPKNKKLVDFLVENCKNGTANLDKLSKSYIIINQPNNTKDAKYELPKEKNKKDLQFDMEKSYYSNDEIIFRNNYTITPIINENNNFNERENNINDITINIDKDLEIDEKKIEEIKKIKEKEKTDSKKIFQCIFNNKELNERIHNIVTKVIPEESKHFKTSLPLFDALNAVENSRAKYADVVDRINSIENIYEDWIAGNNNNNNNIYIFVYKII